MLKLTWTKKGTEKIMVILLGILASANANIPR